MTWKGLHPLIELNPTLYKKGISLTKKEMRHIEQRLERHLMSSNIEEVVSTNWRDDYRIKLNEYEALGVPEYWIVDYAGLRGIQYIGVPKQPSVIINCLVNGEYQATLCQGDQPIGSPTFPKLELTTQQLVAMTED